MHQQIYIRYFSSSRRKQLEIKKPEDNEIEDVYIVIKNETSKITDKYNNIKEYLGDEHVNVKKLNKEGDYVQINYWMNNEIYSVMYTDKISISSLYTRRN